jgi:hypothetical protein
VAAAPGLERISDRHGAARSVRPGGALRATAVRQIALRGAVLEAEPGRVTDAWRRRNAPDDEDLAAFAQQLPQGVVRLRGEGDSGQEDRRSGAQYQRRDRHAKSAMGMVILR